MVEMAVVKLRSFTKDFGDQTVSEVESVQNGRAAFHRRSAVCCRQAAVRGSRGGACLGVGAVAPERVDDHEPDRRQRLPGSAAHGSRRAVAAAGAHG